MKTLHFLMLAFIACLPAHANVPKKAPEAKYSGLWTNSPFTSKPPIVGPGVPVNPFEDFTLTGIAPVPGGYHITIMSRKNPDVKEVLTPGVTNKRGFKVISVNRNPEKALGTTVVLSSGSVQGTVSFEPELITLKAAPTAPVPPQDNPNLPPGVSDPNQPPQPLQTGQRQPRPRIVPPTVPAAQQPPQPQPQNQGGGRGGETRREDRRR